MLTVACRTNFFNHNRRYFRWENFKNDNTNAASTRVKRLGLKK